MMLADMYQEARQYEKSLDLCNRLLASAAVKRTAPEQRSYAYYKRARNTYLLMADKFDADATIKDYSASVAAAPKADWADEALFYAGNIQWNHKQDADAAVLTWERLVREYPGSKEAPTSAFYIGVALLEETVSRGRKALEAFLERYPDSVHTRTARLLLASCEQDMKSGAGLK